MTMTVAPLLTRGWWQEAGFLGGLGLTAIGALAPAAASSFHDMALFNAIVIEGIIGYRVIKREVDWCHAQDKEPGWGQVTPALLPLLVGLVALFIWTA